MPEFDDEKPAVLIVDDDAAKRMAMAAALEPFDIDVATVDSGAEALRQCLARDFAVVLLDVHMPGMDGFETARMIHERPRSQHTPIIFVTAVRTDEEDRFAGYRSGAVDYLLVPYSADILRSKVAVFADLHRLRSRLAAANEELRSSTHSVSHDLCAPLRTIQGFAELLASDCAGALDERGRDHLHRIVPATRHMGALIDDLLVLSRVGQAEIHAAAVDLSALAREVADGLREHDSKRDARIDIAPGIVVSGDAGLLGILIENLLDNAWKFTARRQTAHVELTGQSEGNMIFCYIWGNGAGFDMDHAGKLFTPFHRLHPMSEFPGTGSGLATVRRVVERHGGRIRAESAPEQGARPSVSPCWRPEGETGHAIGYPAPEDPRRRR